MAQATLAIIILFSLAKGKSISAFGTRYFKVWHRCLPGDFVLRLFSLNVRKVYRSYAHLYSTSQRGNPVCMIDGFFR